MQSSFYITSPIYYVNDVPHLGHAYTTLACDFISRFKRHDGYDVKFLTGTDEHGEKIEKSAIKAGMEPQAFVDRVSQEFMHMMKVMNFSYDDFMRTSQSRHKEFVKKIWLKLIDNGYIYQGKYAGWYAVRDEAFYDAKEIVDGKAPSGAEVEWVEEPSYFFKLSAFGDKLLEFYANNPQFIAPEGSKNEVISFVRSGLNDLSISRTSFSWGIQVPGNEKHVMYVWLDALCNYLSAVGGAGSKYWPADLHIVGKDILRFHAVYWPAFLMAADIELPKRIFSHGWWMCEGEKMSKSLGNVISPLQLVESFGLDYVRYFLMREVPFGNDGNYVQQSFINRVNAELVNNIGNLSQRVLAFINKYCDAKVPKLHQPEAEDIALMNKARATIDLMRTEIDKQALNQAVGCIIELSSSANEYIDAHAPWRLRAVDEQRMETVLYTLVDVIRIIAILLQPLLPHSAEALLTNLGLEKQPFSSINTSLISGSVLPSPNIVFPRIDKK